MSSIHTPSLVFQGADNQMSNLRGKVRASSVSGVPATPRMALGEVSNLVRHSSAIEATPKLRSNGLHKPKQSSSDSDEFDEIETIREISREDCFEGLLNTSPVFSSVESFGELSDVGSDEEDDEEYPPIEQMFSVPRGFEEFSMSQPDPEEEEMFSTMCRDDDLVPMYVSAKFTFVENQKYGEVEYEPMPDETLMNLDLSGCDF